MDLENNKNKLIIYRTIIYEIFKMSLIGYSNNPTKDVLKIIYNELKEYREFGLLYSNIRISKEYVLKTKKAITLIKFFLLLNDLDCLHLVNKDNRWEEICEELLSKDFIGVIEIIEFFKRYNTCFYTLLDNIKNDYFFKYWKYDESTSLEKTCLTFYFKEERIGELILRNTKEDFYNLFGLIMAVSGCCLFHTIKDIKNINQWD